MDRVAKQLISRLQRDPQDHPAYEALKDHYRSHGDIASLVNLIAGWAAQSQVPEASAAAFLEAAELLRHGTGQEERRIGFCHDALGRAPLFVDAVAHLQALHVDQGRLRAFTAWLSAHIATVQEKATPSDNPTLGQLYSSLGAALQDLGDPDGARECYARAAHLAPQGQDTLAQANEEKARHYLESAHGAAQQQGDVSGAINILREALRDLPGDVQVMHQLSGYLLQRAHSNPEQIETLDLRRAAELLYQIAQGLLDTPDESTPYLEAALEAAPDHDGALSLLEQIAPQSGRADRLPLHWVNYLAVAAPGPETDRRRLALGRAYALAGQLDDAIYCLEQLPRSNAEAAALLSSLVTTPGSLVHELDVDTEGRVPRPRRPTPSESKRAEDAARVATLHKEVHRLVSLDSQEQAAARCRDIIDIDPTDPEAYFFLESHYRRLRAFAELRELLLASTRTPGLPVSRRRERLLEVAHLSERKLGDVDTAIAALQSVVTLSSSDSDAARNLKRLLRSGERWDELVDLLERETLSTTTADDKATLLEQLAHIHREKRNDLPECARALAQLHELRPESGGLRDELVQTLLELEHYSEAAPLLFERAKEAKDDGQREQELRELLGLCERTLTDGTFTYGVAEVLQAIAPGDPDALRAMERLDEASGDTAALLRTLGRQADAASGAQRASLLMRIAVLHDTVQNDTERAAQAFAQALEAEPGNDATINALSELFERAGRHEDLAELLLDQTEHSESAEFSVTCLRKLARLCDEVLGDGKRAAGAYERLLSFEEDASALEYLSISARERGDTATEVSYLQRLQAVQPVREKRRDTLYEMAILLRDDLNDPAGAERTLSLLLEEVDGTFEPAIGALSEVAEDRESKPGQRLALRHGLLTTGATRESIDVAKALASMCAEDPADMAQARAAYEHWMAADPDDPEPVRALVPLLTDARDYPALRDALDELVLRLSSEGEKRDTILEAARVGFVLLEDTAYTWNRLQPLVERHDEEACARMLELCQKAGWVDRLANLHIASAQAAEDGALQHSHWRTAATLLKEELGAPDRALQAALRALASNVGDAVVLAMVERLCLETRAYERLDHVYDKLLKQSADEEQKLGLLLRHAALLEDAGRRRETAFSQLARASAIRPDDESLLDRMEALAADSEPQLPMLGLYEQRWVIAGTPHKKQAVLLRAARYCENQALDRPAAMRYLVRALGEAEQEPNLIVNVIGAAADFDSADSAEHGALRALISEQRSLAKRVTPEFGRLLVLGSAHLQEERLGEPRAALDTLRAGMKTLPMDDELYQEAKRLSLSLGRLEALEAHLLKLVADAVDAKATVTLLRRQADLLEQELGRPEEAVSVYSKLVQLQPQDAAAAARLRAVLKATGRYQELLVALKKQIDREADPAVKLELLRDIARTWDGGLRNRYEALEAWQKVRAASPDDGDAARALSRLESGDGEIEFADPPWGASMRSVGKSLAPDAAAETEATGAPGSGPSGGTEKPAQDVTTGDTPTAGASEASEPDQDETEREDEGFDLDSLTRSLDSSTATSSVASGDGAQDEPPDEEISDLHDAEEISTELPAELLLRPVSRSLPPPPPEQTPRRNVSRAPATPSIPPPPLPPKKGA